MENKLRVVFLDPQSVDMRNYWQGLAAEYGFDFMSPFSGDDAEADALLAGADVFLVQRRPLTAAMINSAPKLKFIQKYGCRRDGIDLQAARQRGLGVALMSLPGTAAVAEHVFALMLSAAKRIVVAHQLTASGAYQQLGIQPQVTSERSHAFQWMKITGLEELRRLTLGIIGFGEIGTEVAKRAHAFEMDVIYHDHQQLEPDLEAELGVKYCSKDELLQRADFITLHAPHTPMTDKMIGARELTLMKPTAFLINCSRGGVIDEAALVEALHEHRIAGAGLDVFLQEPVPFDHPLLALDNVILTPHIAGGKGGARERQPRSVFANIRRVFDGQPVEYRIL